MISSTSSVDMPRAYQAYVITHTASQKRYVGIFQKKVSSVNTNAEKQKVISCHRRWREHAYAATRRVNRPKSLLAVAIIEHGKDAFTYEVVASAKNWADLCALESILIEQHNTFFLSPLSNGYNMTIGGEGSMGFPCSESRKQKIAAKILGIKRSPETIAKFKARKMTAEQIETRSAKRRGRKQSPETVEKRAIKLQGKKRSEAVKLAASARQKGKKLSDTHRTALALGRLNLKINLLLRSEVIALLAKGGTSRRDIVTQFEDRVHPSTVRNWIRRALQ